MSLPDAGQACARVSQLERVGNSTGSNRRRGAAWAGHDLTGSLRLTDPHGERPFASPEDALERKPSHPDDSPDRRMNRAQARTRRWVASWMTLGGPARVASEEPALVGINGCQRATCIPSTLVWRSPRVQRASSDRGSVDCTSLPGPPAFRRIGRGRRPSRAGPTGRSTLAPDLRRLSTQDRSASSVAARVGPFFGPRQRARGNSDLAD